MREFKMYEFAFIVLTTCVQFMIVEMRHLEIQLDSTIRRNNTDVEAFSNCTLKDGVVGFCVPVFSCQANYDVITQGKAIIYNRNVTCQSYLDVCCSRSDILNSSSIVPKPDFLPKKVGCGWANPHGVGFKMTGFDDNETGFGEFPWSVIVYRQEPVNASMPDGITAKIYISGGSLIHPRVVLTAAQKLVGREDILYVRAGDWDVKISKEIYPHQDRQVEHKYIYQGYTGRSEIQGTDIAILILSSPMELTPNVGVVCLPSMSEKPVEGNECVVSGWGRYKIEPMRIYSAIIKKEKLPIKGYGSTCDDGELVDDFPESMLCANKEGRGHYCVGDIGTPLICPLKNQRNRYVQVGISSWGVSCQEPEDDAYYIMVSSFREWIDDIMKKNNLDVSEYILS